MKIEDQSMQEIVSKLGLRAIDLVTGFTGVNTSVSFDLYGCVQILLTPPAEDNGKLESSRYFDHERIEFVGDVPVMGLPSFAKVKGPQEKPLPQ